MAVGRAGRGLRRLALVLAVLVAACGPGPGPLPPEREPVAASAAAEDAAAGTPGTATCRAPRIAPGDALGRAFLDGGALPMTCPVAPGPVLTVHDPEAALALRLEALTGSPVPREALRRGDPDMPLDFSRAPELERIVISYLHMRADVSGRLVARALAHHAARGTPVQILVSDRLMLPRERAFYDGLAALHPSVEVAYFSWSGQSVNVLVEGIDRAHRVNHVKIFATVARQPGRSWVLVGGRNLHDGYFYDAPPQPPEGSGVRAYGPTEAQGLALFAIFDDFDVALRGDSAVRAIVAQFDAVWPGAPAPPLGPAPLVPGEMRHFLSAPWADGRALERWMVDLFDAAEREILIVTPFPYPPPALEAAMLRAAGRGVEVRMLARTVSTDSLGGVVTRLNRTWLERNAGRYALWSYDPGWRNLHAKILVIDGRLGVVTSANLNWRSFLHDTENGVVFLDPGVAARLVRQAERWIAVAERVPPGEGNGLGRTLLRLPWLLQYF